MRIDCIVPVRGTFKTNGGRVFLTSKGPATLIEFSPEFYPLSFVP